ncbi:hypothetical protein QBC38DRAFT_456417 [Podospora fimiseda]|uniref:Uncharacterized protein n=1 Tax=Podospora fimiseda TaxID=252190 RepID=A0AAN7BN09_9PEZI|nr:hypothetical protein QBC38DRAFT_456417 [Podospora fimiseda]
MLLFNLVFLLTTLVYAAPLFVPPPGTIYISEGVYLLPSNSSDSNTENMSLPTLAPQIDRCIRADNIENRASAISPLVSDCRRLCHNIRTDGIW